MSSAERRYTTPPAETSRWTGDPRRPFLERRFRFVVDLAFEVEALGSCSFGAGVAGETAVDRRRRRRRRFLGGCSPSEVGSSVTRES
jgi:hypothetical protein